MQYYLLYSNLTDKLYHIQEMYIFQVFMLYSEETSFDTQFTNLS